MNQQSLGLENVQNVSELRLYQTMIKILLSVKNVLGEILLEDMQTIYKRQSNMMIGNLSIQTLNPASVAEDSILHM